MNLSRVLSTAARQASIRSAASGSVGKLSQRGFAVAASQQLQSNQGAENANNSSRVHGLLAAAAAAAGMTAIANEKNDRTAECCGIAGVVGASGDARYVCVVNNGIDLFVGLVYLCFISHPLSFAFDPFCNNNTK